MVELSDKVAQRKNYKALMVTRVFSNTTVKLVWFSQQDEKKVNKSF